MASLPIDEAVQLYSTLQHFFEVAVHAVLYYRRLYPERAFGSATAFDAPVHLSRHPAVCAWVRAAIEQVMLQLAGGDETAKTDNPATDRVNAIAVVVHAPYQRTAGSGSRIPAGAVLERWVFDVRHMPRSWPGGIEALRRAQNHGPHDAHDDTGEPKVAGDSEGEQKRSGTRTSRLSSPEKEKLEANADEDGVDDDLNGSHEPRYIYYDEEEELANAESEAELDEETEESENEDIKRAAGGNAPADKSPGNCAANAVPEAVKWTDLDNQLRGVLQRLAQAGQQLAELPEDCTFTVAIELADETDGARGSGTASRHMDTNWIPETGGRKHQMFGANNTAAGASITSIRSTDCAPLYLECWVEESAIKHAAAEGATRAQLAAKAASKNGDVLPIPKVAVPPKSKETSHKNSKTPKTKPGKTVSFTS
ncbi:hypothetical protein SEPCBS119000_000775 [Sporothrix epigloea]|uniref:HORMA domain-containing protein n=1 Tax=Sporothrix epigloea TaxID=1892477 RepID=A0ABP0D9L1_9PEZI